MPAPSTLAEMRVDGRFVGWGLFFIVAGALPLAVQGGYLPADAASQVWRLWPLILVGLGVGIILGRTPLGWLGSLLVPAIFGLLVGSALAGGIAGVACGFDVGDPSIGAQATVGGELTEGGTVELDFDCGPLDVGTAAGPGWSLTYRRDVEPRIDESPERLRVVSPEGAFLGRGSDWDVTLPAGRTLSLSVEANAASASLTLTDALIARFSGAFNAASFDVDLSRTRLGDLDIRLNAGSGSVTLPSASFSGRIDVNAGSLELCAPADVGLRITTSGALSSTDFAGSGLVLSGSTWQSPGFATAATRIELTLNANAASVNLRREGGCP